MGYYVSDNGKVNLTGIGRYRKIRALSGKSFCIAAAREAREWAKAGRPPAWRNEINSSCSP
jgi:hypothetical protein